MLRIPVIGILIPIAFIATARVTRVERPRFAVLAADLALLLVHVLVVDRLFGPLKRLLLLQIEFDNLFFRLGLRLGGGRLRATFDHLTLIING